MVQFDRLWEFVQRLSPLTRSCLLGELERLEISGVEVPGSADILAKLRAEFRQDGSTQHRASTPSRYFFTPVEQLLFDGSSEYGNTGRIARASITPIWEWISRDLLPTMARDYNQKMKELIAAEKPREALKVAATFQTKVTKSLEGILKSADSAVQIRAKLAAYTAAPSVFEDVLKLLRAMQARDALAKFNDALPERINKFDDAQIRKMIALLGPLRQANADALPFALTLIANRLKKPAQILNLAVKSARGKTAADIAGSPYAIAAAMVLDQIEDKRLILRVALKNNRVVPAKAILTDIYDTEKTLRRIDRLDESDWGKRLDGLMEAITTMVDTEVNRFPDEVGHILGSMSARGQHSLTDRLTSLADKGRGAIQGGAAFWMRLVS